MSAFADLGLGGALQGLVLKVGVEQEEHALRLDVGNPVAGQGWRNRTGYDLERGKKAGLKPRCIG